MKVPTNVKTFFVSGQRKPLHRSTANLLLKKYGVKACLPCADTRLIQDFLGHRSISHTVRYRASSPARFKRLWW
jgi:type 1 fimbriae regulatory protein FimB